MFVGCEREEVWEMAGRLVTFWGEVKSDQAVTNRKLQKNEQKERKTGDLSEGEI